jgi:hypothetical protein
MGGHDARGAPATRYRGDRPDLGGKMRGDPLDHSGEGRLLERQGRMSAPPGDRGQLDFLQHVQRIVENRVQSPI